MTDVFVTTIALEPVRQYLFLAVVRRWMLEEQRKICVFKPGIFWQQHYVTDTTIPILGIGHPSQMQRDRRIKADELARSEIYIVTDDDCMPIGADFIARGLAVMEAHPDFGILAAMNYWNRNDSVPYTGRFIDADVWECHAVGGIRFCRKGIIKEWPESVNPGSYDCQHHEALVKAGYRTGYMRNVQMNHIGLGLSQHWPEVSEIDQLYRKEKVLA